MTTLRLAGVAITIDGRRILRGVDLEVRSGEVMGVVGPSGSGKTSLLRVMAGLSAATEGSVVLDEGRSRRPGEVAMALQDDPVYSHLDVAGNLGFPLDMARMEVGERDRRVEGTARRVGVRKVLSRRPTELSGGERAAVSVGRALVSPRAGFVLLDEPLAKADARRRRGLRVLLRTIATERPDLGLVIASNDQADLIGLVDRLVVMHSGEIAQAGSPMDVYEWPVDLRVAAFLGVPPMNLFPAAIQPAGEGLVAAIGTDRIALDAAAGIEGAMRSTEGPLVVGVRPEHLRVAGPGTRFDRVLHATVGWVEEPTGIVWFGLGTVGTTAYALVQRPVPHVEVGDRLELTWAPERTRIFDAESGRAIPKSIIGSAD